MPIPAGNVSTVNLDATTDSPATARADLLALTQQFNTLIASANGVSGMAVLDASGFLAGYGRLSAANPWTGVNTFTGAIPIILSSANPTIQGRITSVALPNGLWRFYFPSTDGDVYLTKNTAAAGDFSTNTNVLRIGSASAAYTGTIAIAAGVAAGDAVNKGQLDAKVYGGRIANNGTASVAYGPTGWTVSRSSAGITVVTHNLGTTSYSVVVTTDGGLVLISLISALTANSFTIATANLSATSVDAPYQFVVVRN